MAVRNFIILLTAAVLASPLHAQSAKLTLRTLALGSAAMPRLWAANADKPVAIPISAIQPSEPLRIERHNPLRIFKGDLGDNGLPNDPAPTSVQVPDAPAILLLGWMAGDATRFIAVPDPFASARHDDWLVVNTTNRPVAIQIGTDTKPTAVKPSAHATVRVTAPANEGAAVIVAAPRDKVWKTIYSTYWPIYQDKRCLVIMAEDGAKIRVKVIADEFKPPAANGENPRRPRR